MADDCVLVRRDGEWRLTVDAGNSVNLNGANFTGETILRPEDELLIGGDRLVLRTLQAEHADFEEEAGRTYAEARDPMHPLRLRFLFIQWALSLIELPDMDTIREGLFSLLFQMMPADRVAIEVDHSLAGRHSVNGAESVTPDPNPDGVSKVCIPLQGRGYRMGFIYVETSGPGFDPMQVRMLTGIAPVAALAFACASYIEQLEARNSNLEQQLGLEHDLIGESPKIVEMMQVVAKVAPKNTAVLIRGETGAGKELVARAIHRNSGRKGLFHDVNCAAIPATLQDSQLFGHEKGAFTGADRARKGDFEVADRGTLFFDEVGELSLEAQAALLRVLEERQIRRVGGSAPIPVDVRIIAATNRDLEDMVAKGRFREDLFYRLNVVTIETPPLRERREDIPRIASGFLQRFRKEHGSVVQGISPQAEQILLNYDWPGNVRQLRNAIDYAVIMTTSTTILPKDLPAELSSKSVPENGARDFHQEIHARKCELIEWAFKQARGDSRKAAELLKLNRTHIYKVIKSEGMGHLLQ